ncbi:MAG TPA: glycosyltransferase family 2 protein [Candidatus Handelsmanbacteria bacterium]|nr:glycosyltransferase family 2 protein [Candidatus Handelsmanbacteria bacterium]
MVGVDTTIVIPMRDEKATIATMVEVLTTDKPLATRILLVDAGSTDGTVQIAQDLARTHDLVDVIEVGAAWPGQARNIGIAASLTQWVLLLDAGERFLDFTLVGGGLGLLAEVLDDTSEEAAGAAGGVENAFL